jgi:ethanolamine utilization protein EutQ
MELDKAMLENIIREVIRGEMNKPSAKDPRQIDPSGVIGIDPNDFPVEKFPFPIESDRVWLRDLISVEESPRLGCGMMEMDSTSFEWTLTYDEIDYVLDGTLDIVIDGRTVRAEKGGVVFIPKNTKIRFSAPGKVRFLYVVYPANWAEQ